MKNSLYYKFKPVAFPVGIIVIVLILAFFAGNLILQKLGTIRSEIARLETSNGLLSIRLKTLEDVPVEINDSIQLVSRALPPDTPAILITKQIRDIAIENEIIIEEMRIVRSTVLIEDDDSVTETDLNFDITGTLEKVNSLVDSLKSITPLVNMLSLDLEQNVQDNTVKASIVMKSFSSELPKTLPSITEPISELSEEEINTLDELKTFRQPEIGSQTIIPVATDSGRTNPFALNL